MVVTTFAEFARDLDAQPLSADVTHHAKRAVIDWFAALVPGAVQAPCVLMERAGRRPGSRAGSLGTGRLATARAAALINGTAAHTVEVDDIYREAIYHPGAPTIAAALAAAQDRNESGERFLKAVTAGYEISTRIGAALGRAHYRFWHNTGTVGTFGASAAVAMIHRLDTDRFAHALAGCATFAAGLQQAFRMDSMSKPLHAGHAADAGWLAACMAAQGVTGSLNVIDGEAGLGFAMSDGPDWQQAVSTLGKDFHITRITFKNHACCGHTFAAIDGALELMARHSVDVNQIDRIRIGTYRPARSKSRGTPNRAHRSRGTLQPSVRGRNRTDPWQRSAGGLRAGPHVGFGDARTDAAHRLVGRSGT